MTSLDNFRKQCVLIVGDLMVDRYIIGTVDRISPEAPIPVLLQQQITRKLGGMGNVVLNVASLSAKVRVVGRVGSDEEGRYLRDTLKENGVDDSYVFSEGKTIVKTRVAASNQQFLRIDEETILPPSREIVEALQSGIDRMMKDITVVIISDYAKGFVTEEVAQIIIGGARRAGIPVLVDPKGKSAAKYRGATAMTPNTKEFKDMAGLSALPDEEGIRAAAAKLCLENDLKYLIYTRSEKGISTIYGKTGEKQDYPAVEKEVVDVTGAGDTVVSVLALSMASGFELRRCVKMANVAASIVISRFGAAQTTIEELDGELHPSRKKVMDPQRMIQTIHQLQQGGKHIVFTNGCFDLVHAGHISSFRQAAASATCWWWASTPTIPSAGSRARPAPSYRWRTAWRCSTS